MTILGGLHVGAAVVALVTGGLVLVARKGTRRHVLLGRVYGTGMLLVNLPALLLHEEFGTLGPFHVLALISLVTLALGLAPLLLGYRGAGPIARHGMFMVWSYVGLVAAGLAQLGNSMYGGTVVLYVSLVVVVVAGVIIHFVAPHIERAPEGVD